MIYWSGSRFAFILGGLGKGFFKENPCSLKEGTSIVWPYALKQKKDFADNEVLKTRPRFSSLKSGREILTMLRNEWKPVNNLLTCHSMEPPLEIQLSTELSHAHKSYIPNTSNPFFFDSQTNFVEKELFNIVGKEIGSQECKSRAK